MRLIGFEGVHDQIDLTSTAYLQCENKYEKCQLELGNSHHGTSRTRTVLYILKQVCPYEHVCYKYARTYCTSSSDQNKYVSDVSTSSD